MNETQKAKVLHDLRTPNDKLHINTKGYCILVKLIKQAIFSLKRNKSSHVTGRLYSHAVMIGRHD